MRRIVVLAVAFVVGFGLGRLYELVCEMAEAVGRMEDDQ